MPGSSNPPRVFHDASIYTMYEAEAGLVDGKISLPDLRIQYETADGERAYIDLELATENYRPAHMRQKLARDSRSTVSTQPHETAAPRWEGRELTAQELAL